MTETAQIPPYSRIRRETWSGCHGGAEVETMTIRTGPEDHPWATTSLDVVGRKHQAKLQRVK